MNAAQQQPLHWRNILFLSITLLAAVVAIPLHLLLIGWSWSLFLLFAIGSAATSLSITAGYHRLFAHRSYEASTPLRLFYVLFGAAAFQGSVLEWANDHRRHHTFVDGPHDPHNIREGFFWAHMGWLFYKSAPEYSAKMPFDLRNDALVAWQYRHYVPIAVAMGFGLPTLLGWLLFGDALGGFLWGGVLRVVVTNHTTFLINSLAHTLGTRTYNGEQTARDSVVMAFLAYGEGYHNYHHQFAHDYRNGVRWYQWDPTKWFILGAAAIGLAKKLKRIPSPEIELARIRAQQQTLLRQGAPAERIQAFRTRLEEAQRRWRTLREDYRSRKGALARQSRAYLVHLQAELRVAKIEFRSTCRQWAAYYRTLRRARGMSSNGIALPR
jgi:stearoyl-CoA desaturase (delta-9 desaturase)